MTEEQQALRFTTAWTLLGHYRMLVLHGKDRQQAMASLISCDLKPRYWKVVQGLFLKEDGSIFADVYTWDDEEQLYLLAEGPEQAELEAWLKKHLDPELDVSITDISGEQDLAALCGPYAWELLSELIGPQIIGLPLMTAMKFENIQVLRAGKCGEYSYLFLGTKAEITGWLEKVQECGKDFALGEISLEDLDLARLENGLFNIRAEGRSVSDPLKLQLSYLILPGKSFPGSHIIATSLKAGPKERTVTCLGPAGGKSGNEVFYNDEKIGTVINASLSGIRNEWVYLCLLDADYAFPGISEYQTANGVNLRTVSAPVIRNRSMYINPQKHSFQDRKQDDFPDINQKYS